MDESEVGSEMNFDDIPVKDTKHAQSKGKRQESELSTYEESF